MHNLLTPRHIMLVLLIGLVICPSATLFQVLHSRRLTGLKPGSLARWVATAQAGIAGLPDVPARHAFETFCDFVMGRTS